MNVLGEGNGASMSCVSEPEGRDDLAGFVASDELRLAMAQGGGAYFRETKLFAMKELAAAAAFEASATATRAAAAAAAAVAAAAPWTEGARIALSHAPLDIDTIAIYDNNISLVKRGFITIEGLTKFQKMWRAKVLLHDLRNLRDIESNIRKKNITYAAQVVIRDSSKEAIEKIALYKDPPYIPHPHFLNSLSPLPPQDLKIPGVEYGNLFRFKRVVFITLKLQFYLFILYTWEIAHQQLQLWKKIYLL